LDTKLGGALPLRMRHKAMHFVLKSRDGEDLDLEPRRDLRPFFGVPLLRFGHEIRWCFAVAHAPQAMHFVLSKLVGRKMRQICVTSFSRVPEGALGPFLGFLCYVFFGRK